MSYDEDVDDDSPSRTPSRRRRGSARMGQKHERPDVRRDVREDLIQATLAACAPVVPGQIYAVQPGNNGAHTVDTIADALYRANGKRSIAAGYLGMKIRALDSRIANDERLQEVIYEIEEAGLDVAEIQLDALVMSGADKAVIFKLKTKGKVRGWADNKQPAQGNTLTLDAARELDSKLVSAFVQFRQMAVDAITSPVQQPAIEQKLDTAPARVDVEDAVVIDTVDEEFDGAGFSDKP